MSRSLMFWLLGALAAVAAGAAWRHYLPRSFWLIAAFPVRAVLVRLTWTHVASGCGLAPGRLRWRWTLDAVPVAGHLSRARTLIAGRRRLRRVTRPHPPGLGLLRPDTLGWTVKVRMRHGQVPGDYAAAAERLAHAWRVHAVRVVRSTPGRVWLQAIRTDPLTAVSLPAAAGELLTVTAGRLETGEPWVLDFRVVPHWLNAGATQSGKSNLANVIISALAPQPVALAGFDLKGGVEFTPYAPRLSALAVTRAESVTLLGDLVRMVTARMALCREHGARNIWRLPERLRPVPVVVLVDEVAELFLMADRTEKTEVTKTATGLLRLAQLGRAFGLYLIVSGQRIGSDLGPGVTALRAQMTGRICHRVNDPETAAMTLGDLDPAALDAARAIPADTPGVCVVAGQDGTWHRARSILVTEHDAQTAAAAWAHLAPDWHTLTHGIASAAVPPVLTPVPGPEPGAGEAA